MRSAIARAPAAGLCGNRRGFLSARSRSPLRRSPSRWRQPTQQASAFSRCGPAAASFACRDRGREIGGANAGFGKHEPNVFRCRFIAREMRRDRAHLFIAGRHQERRRAPIALDADREISRFGMRQLPGSRAAAPIRRNASSDRSSARARARFRATGRGPAEARASATGRGAARCKPRCGPPVPSTRGSAPPARTVRPSPRRSIRSTPKLKASSRRPLSTRCRRSSPSLPRAGQLVRRTATEYARRDWLRARPR